MKVDIVDKGLTGVICILLLLAGCFVVYLGLDEIRNWEPDPVMTTTQYSEQVKRARMLHDNY